VTALETSGVTTRLIMRYVREHGGEPAVHELLRRARVPYELADLDDESRWVSYDTRIRLFEAAVEVLGDPDCTFAMGATSLRTGMNHSLILLLRALGTPRQVYRQLPRSVPKFSTTSTMEVLELTTTQATLSFRLHDGYPHSRLDCRYAQGLISMVPEIFGLRPATVVHEACQSDGSPACVYELRWARRSRLPWRRGGQAHDPELVALRGQLQALQFAASELVGSDDLGAVLRRITHRAATAVLAPAYLLAVTDPDGGPPMVHSEGLPESEVEDLSGRLLAGEDLGRGAVVVDVESSRRRHGRLAALYPVGQHGPTNERALLSAYAGHAAAALDLLLALDRSRRGESRSTALLALAHELKAATDPDTIADVVVNALPGVVGCDTSTVLFWDPSLGVLHPIASSGLTSAEHEIMHAGPIRAEDTPELVDLLTRQEPKLVSVDSASAGLRQLLEALGLVGFMVVPLLGRGELLGVATACWRAGRMPHDAREVVTRLQGVGEYAATAVQNARLLSTVQHQALHDALTGLPNRVLFTRELERMLVESGRDGGTAVLFCDLDKFKHVNDGLGHAGGDELLRQVAARLRGVLRAGDVVGRLSGDEFALLLPGVTDPAVAEALAQRVVSCFQTPFRVEGRELRVTTSVGVAVHRGPGGRADHLLRAADGAMYVAKQGGRNQVAATTSTATGASATSTGTSAGTSAGTGATATWTAPGPAAVAPDTGSSLEAELHAAVDAGQLRLVFQPLVAVSGAGGPGALDVPVPDGAPPQVVGAEALVRWEHPRLGLLTPAAFLPLAEETGQVVRLDLWAVRAACAALAAWPDGPAGPLHVAVNLASSTLQDPRLHETVRAALADHGLAPERLYLEVVESRSLADVPAVVDRLLRLRQLGVKIALDDFGTGYSTLSWLQRLPVNQLKIDRTFTAALPGDVASLGVVRGVLALAGELGIEVVAEGVEDEAQLEALQRAGCTVIQGFLFGRPAADVPGLLTR
jgi:diguanylate cyclase (GGDEF)-like protein